ncbi:MAG TPA: hypothetical protein DIT25_04320 [Candidatus Moranbacteria bacterium]|nr:hypothetical protein [Candidatus Moranbacteria bacterium]
MARLATNADPLGMFKGKKTDYNEELKRWKKEQAALCKREASLRNSREGYSSNSVMTMFLIFLTFAIVAIMLYAIYLFVHVTRISDMAGVHVTPVFKKAANLANSHGVSKEFAERGAGYGDWILFKNNKFSLMYPEGWDIKESDGITLRQFNSRDKNAFDSLSMAMSFGELKNPDRLALKEALQENGRNVSEAMREEEIRGKKTYSSNNIILENGLHARGIYWVFDDRIFFAETVKYNKESDHPEETCEKIIDSIRFY